MKKTMMFMSEIYWIQYCHETCYMQFQHYKTMWAKVQLLNQISLYKSWNFMRKNIIRRKMEALLSWHLTLVYGSLQVVPDINLKQFHQNIGGILNILHQLQPDVIILKGRIVVGTLLCFMDKKVYFVCVSSSLRSLQFRVYLI